MPVRFALHRSDTYYIFASLISNPFSNDKLLIIKFLDYILPINSVYIEMFQHLLRFLWLMNPFLLHLIYSWKIIYIFSIQASCAIQHQRTLRSVYYNALISQIYRESNLIIILWQLLNHILSVSTHYSTSIFNIYMTGIITDTLSSNTVHW